MKATGITRKVDDLGRVVLPIELRRNLGIEVADTLEIFTEGDDIILRRYNAVDGLLTMASRMKNRVAVEDCGEIKPILLDKLAEIEKIIKAEAVKH
ncbi:AbrB/MazE/SpoVT family DNA-binding domain-containing protein [Anaerotignum propionicum]|uniref:AbrB/MazE/SpoVT family DNA-binding domain-containing protein n=1 Tax=Anaerotignum propionicum TaxID=28446 RepID=UPI0028989B13|nr:AbrB/MazE/SpoVT family DNA-binding domain-containing protein [Anaerotignum propionicum]